MKFCVYNTWSSVAFTVIIIQNTEQSCTNWVTENPEALYSHTDAHVSKNASVGIFETIDDKVMA